MPLKHHLILSADQMRIDQRQATGLHPLAHHQLALIALAQVKWRGIDDRQHFRARLPAQSRRRLKPGILANQQSDLDLVTSRASFKDANPLPRREIAALVKNLIVGQLTLGIGRQHRAFAQHTGSVVAILDGNGAGSAVTTAGVPKHQRQVF